MPLSKVLYRTCIICGQRCKCWPKLTSWVISDVKPIIYIYTYILAVHHFDFVSQIGRFRYFPITLPINQHIKFTCVTRLIKNEALLALFSLIRCLSYCQVLEWKNNLLTFCENIKHTRRLITFLFVSFQFFSLFYYLERGAWRMFRKSKFGTLVYLLTILKRSWTKLMKATTKIERIVCSIFNTRINTLKITLQKLTGRSLCFCKIQV